MIEPHPLTELIPTRADLSELVMQIAQSGLAEPVVLYEGKIIEGRVRYQAAMANPVGDPRRYNVPTKDWVLITDRDDPLDWMVRRHVTTHALSELDRIKLAATVLPHYRQLRGQTEVLLRDAVGLSNRKIRVISWLQEAGGLDKVLSGEKELFEAGREIGIVSERRSIALGKSYGHGDKFDEATQPLKRYLAKWKRKGYEFRHLNPKEAQRRLLVIQQLQEELNLARPDLEKRAVTATLSAPPERKGRK